MKLRGKTLILMIVTILSLTIGFSIISQNVFISSSAESENNYAQLTLNNAINSLNNSLDSLNDSVNDWSSWDDAYNYVSGNFPAFENRTLINESFSRLNVNFILFADNNGKIVYAKAYDRTKKQELQLPPNFEEDIKKNNLLLDKSRNKSLSGIIILNGTPMLVVSEKIFKSSGEGPSHGTLIMGRYLDQDMLSRLSNNTVISVEPFNGSNIPSDFQNARSYLSNETPIYVTNLNDNSIAGYSILKGINGNPDLILKVELPRFIYTNYKDALIYLILSLIIAGILAAMFITYYLDKSVLYRLDKITTSIIRIGKNNDLSARVPELGNDELYDLSISVNRALESLQESNFNLERSEKRYRTIFENTGTAMIIIGEKMVINLVNNEFEKTTGFSKDEIENKKNLLDFAVKDHLDKIKKHHNFHEFKERNVLNNYEIQLMNKNGNIRDFFATFGFIPGTEKTLISFIDITERKKAENKLKDSSKEKEVLLRELHHRVKNNLQIISTLLALQSEDVTDKKTLENYRESENRIQSIALIHEKMYQSQDISRINFTGYINSLIDDLMYSYDADSRNIKAVTDTDDFFFSIETVQPLGLIINELVSNSLKYAFRNKNEGIILVKLEKVHDDSFKLTVSDNGVGFPENIDFRNTGSLGLQLVTELVKQLDGTIELNKDRGTEFEVVFKEPEYKKRI